MCVAGSTGDIMGVRDYFFDSGTQPLGNGSQMCLDISIDDDQVLEPTERFMICGSSTQNSVVILNDGCSEITIRDNDSKTKYRRI